MKSVKRRVQVELGGNVQCPWCLDEFSIRVEGEDLTVGVHGRAVITDDDEPCKHLVDLEPDSAVFEMTWIEAAIQEEAQEWPHTYLEGDGSPT